jgi:branched-subunit amino acid aminotransferase/4-amino-4-deoxychorismate lyase
VTSRSSVPTDDRGLLLGDGLFETILGLGGELMLLDAHLDRMARGCAVLGLPPFDPGVARWLCEEAMRALGLARAAVRLTLTAGSGGRGLDRPDPAEPRLFATAAPSEKPTRPARLAVVSVRRNEGSPASRLKTLSYLDSVLARCEATDMGAEEAVMLNNRGELACAAAANLFWLADGRLHTPALECGALDGVVRTVLIERARDQGMAVLETRAARDALIGAQAIFLTNSLIGLRAVSTLDGRALPGDPLVERLAGLVADVC